MGLFGRKSKLQEVSIDYDKLAEAIVKANRLIKEDEQNLALKQKEQESKEWNEAMGYKIYSEKETGFKKGHSIKFCVKANPVRQKVGCKASGIWDFLLIA